MLCCVTQQHPTPVLLASGRRTRCIAAPRNGWLLALFAWMYECCGAKDFYCFLTQYKQFVELHIRKMEFVLLSHGIQLANVNNCVFPYLWK